MKTFLGIVTKIALNEGKGNIFLFPLHRISICFVSGDSSEYFGLSTCTVFLAFSSFLASFLHVFQFFAFFFPILHAFLRSYLFFLISDDSYLKQGIPGVNFLIYLLHCKSDIIKQQSTSKILLIANALRFVQSDLLYTGQWKP